MAYVSYSTYFNGSTDYLSIPTNAAFSFGTGDFTIEGWVYLNSLSASYYVVAGAFTTGTTDEWLIQIQNNGNIRFLTIGSNDGEGTTFRSASITTSTWYHLAAVRSGTSITLYVNGTSVGSYTNSNSIGSISKPIYIGIQNGTTWPLNGYISNLRIVKGAAVYTSAFTPSTIPLSTVTNMSLLTCRSATAIDVSTNNLTITEVGSPVISNANTPFSFASIINPNTYYKQIPTVSSTTKQTTELNSLADTTINTSSLSIQISNQKYIPTVASTTKQTTELTSLDSTNNYSVTVSANLVGKKEIPTVPSVTRFSTFIKTSNDPIIDASAGATISQTWTIS